MITEALPDGGTEAAAAFEGSCCSFISTPKFYFLFVILANQTDSYILRDILSIATSRINSKCCNQCFFSHEGFTQDQGFEETKDEKF